MDSRSSVLGGVLPLIVVAGLSALMPLSCWSQQANARAPVVVAPVVEVIGHYENGIGTSDAASQGVVNSSLILDRPTLRAGEVLEFVPGLIVTQHSGTGKANQYFLRGFNLDHGTDFAVHIDGMPVNMRTHGHGQGYADANFLIPELVSRIDYKKGPYFADEGDFASAGAAHFRLYDQLPSGIGTLTVGTDDYLRGLIARSPAIAAGNLLYAVESTGYDGPWVNPENLRKLNGVIRYSQGDSRSGFHFMGMAYRANWDSTDQIAKRAVDSGQLDRFGAIDPTDGGETSRYSLSAGFHHDLGDSHLRAGLYVIKYQLDLWSNFTYFLNDEANGDQFQQADERSVYGGSLTYDLPGKWGRAEMNHRAGVQIRYDDIGKVALYHTRARQILSTTREDKVTEGSAGVFLENSTQWTPWLRTIAGARVDFYQFDVNSSMAQNSGSVHDDIVSPKLGAVFGPWSQTEFFANYGYGFHSNDARGTTITVDPTPPNGPVDRVTPLVRSKGAEIGLRTQAINGVQSSLALWQLKVNSELLFVGDAGTTEASRPSHRQGIEWITTWRPTSWLLFDLDLDFSKARFCDSDPAGDRIPGALARTAQAGVYVDNLGPWSGALQVRHFGPRPLIEDNSVRSKATTLTNMRVGYKVDKTWQAHLDVLNLFDRE